MPNLGKSFTKMPRYITSVQERIKEIELHLFGDASIIGTSAVAYSVIQQTSSKTQGIISSKSQLSKKNTSIPRLELIAAVMVTNLAQNITNSLQHFKVTALHGWSDSMVVLHWVKVKWCLQTIRKESNRSYKFKSSNSVALSQY